MAPDAPEAPTAAEQDTASPWAMSYARTVHGPFEPVPRGKVRVTLLTDPWSVWCWGFEPVRRAIEARYPGIEFRSLVGGMFPRVPDPREAGFDLEAFFGVVQRSTGMPVRTEGMREDRPTSTYPACVFVHAVRLLQPDREQGYLRALREAAYLDGRNVSREAVATAVAARIGIDPGEFAEALASGEPEKDFRDRIAFLHQLDLHAYPTLLITAGEKTARVEGFQSLPGVMGIVNELTGRLHAPVPPPPVERLLSPTERVTTREIAEVCGLSIEQAYDEASRLVEHGRARRERHPAADAWIGA